MNLHYLIGDATEPVVKPALICHVCNDIGGWGRGFVLALSAKNRAPEENYKRWYKDSRNTFILGAIQIVPFADKVWVANMIAQRDIRWNGKIPPIRYDALEQCLNSAYKYAFDNGCTLHAPRLGAVLSGGEWPTIEAIIKKTMTVETYIYTIAAQKDRWPTQYENASVASTPPPGVFLPPPADPLPDPADATAIIDVGMPPDTRGQDLNDLFR